MSVKLSQDDLKTFFSLLQSSELVAADWLEDLDIEYYTEIARQLRGEHGKWLGDRLYYGKSFLCWFCNLQPAYGYKFSYYEGSKLIKEPLLISCESCRDKLAGDYATGRTKLKVQAI